MKTSTVVLMCSVLYLSASSAHGQLGSNPLEGTDVHFDRDAKSFRAEDARLRARESQLDAEAQSLAAEKARWDAADNRLGVKARELAAERERIANREEAADQLKPMLAEKVEALNKLNEGLWKQANQLNARSDALKSELEDLDAEKRRGFIDQDERDDHNRRVNAYNSRVYAWRAENEKYKAAGRKYEAELDDYNAYNARYLKVIERISSDLRALRQKYVPHNAEVEAQNRALHSYLDRQSDFGAKRETAKNDRQDLNRKASALSGRAKARGDTFYYDNSPGGGKGSPPPFNPLSGNPLSGYGLGSPSPAPTGNPLTGNPLSGNPLTGNPPSNVSENPLVGTRGKPPSPPLGNPLGTPPIHRP